MYTLSKSLSFIFQNTLTSYYEAALFSRSKERYVRVTTETVGKVRLELGMRLGDCMCSAELRVTNRSSECCETKLQLLVRRLIVLLSFTCVSSAQLRTLCTKNINFRILKSSFLFKTSSTKEVVRYESSLQQLLCTSLHSLSEIHRTAYIRIKQEV